MASTTAPSSTIFRRPKETSGWMSWITTVDHKKIGIMYGYSAFFFFILGGLEALILRLQLAGPDGTVLDAAEYNAMFTMHGTTMVFLFVMPVGAAFFNYLLPLLIGARDVAFPRMNALSYWIFLFGGLFGCLLVGEHDQRRLVHVPAERRPPVLNRNGARLRGDWTPDSRPFLIDRIGELHHDGVQYACQRNAAAPNAGVRLDDDRRGVPTAVLATDHRCCAFHGDFRPTTRNALLRYVPGRRRHPLATPLLAIRSP